MDKSGSEARIVGTCYAHADTRRTGIQIDYRSLSRCLILETPFDNAHLMDQKGPTVDVKEKSGPPSNESRHLSQTETSKEQCMTTNKRLWVRRRRLV